MFSATQGGIRCRLNPPPSVRHRHVETKIYGLNTKIVETGNTRRRIEKLCKGREGGFARQTLNVVASSSMQGSHKPRLNCRCCRNSVLSGSAKRPYLCFCLVSKKRTNLSYAAGGDVVLVEKEAARSTGLRFLALRFPDVARQFEIRIRCIRVFDARVTQSQSTASLSGLHCAGQPWTRQ